MRRIAISAGHSSVSGKDRGAVYGQYIEGNVAEDLKLRVKYHLETLGIKASIDPKDSVTKDTVKLFSQYFTGKDICVDIHFNASENPNATGTEVVIPAKYSELEYELATELSGYISATLGIRNRGVITELQTYRKKLMWMTIPCENVLIEVCFLSNPRDMQSYERRKDDVARTIATILSNHRKF